MSDSQEDCMTDRARHARRAGVAVWLDDLSRDSSAYRQPRRAGPGARHVVGVTTNPTIFASALSKGDAYDDQLRELAARGADIDEAVLDDHRPRRARRAATCSGTGLRPHRRRRRPGLARGRPPAGARHRDDRRPGASTCGPRVDRPNAFIKIPATEEGLPAITPALVARASAST